MGVKISVGSRIYNRAVSCSACCFPRAAQLTVYKRDGCEKLEGSVEVDDPRIMCLCDVCANTLIGNTAQYPRDESLLLQTIGYCTNMILEAIENK